ncbi:glycoside hydrolase family 43 protein [Paenibacillus sp. HW567]|uniref:glycoside hydrolase family 43 protein n=1 Tax=Paenibacillus sp. HW567 TaxID=1034769 RepID=UPI0003625E7B|nr:glycoside hydrolase family 43 protein [Paenibacillus sp. HW567]
MIRNPILPGFNPDPCICRKGDDYYLAVSTFEWFPGIPVYHSKDLKNWELYTHVLTDDTAVDLKKLPSAKGIWAPSLTYSEKEELFYVVYGVKNSMNARYFDVDNFLITSKDITGPWSEPVYLHSSGFDASILHDGDGKKWIVSLEWETREGYEKPGAICLAEYSPERKEIVGYPTRIWTGGTDRGCIEAPHLTKRGEYYYLMCAEGGTGYGHSVTMGRAENVWGPYLKDPMNPIVTSIPGDFYERHDPDHLKPKYFNPDAVLQKAGHGSYVETQLGEVYLVHLCARPFVPELRCTLGRETAIQKMAWTADGWLRMEDGTNLAKEYVPESQLPEYPVKELPSLDHFDSEELGIQYYAPRIMPGSFADVQARPGYVRIRGQESRTSLNKVSILARKLTSVYAMVTTQMEFTPEVPQHSAGLILYYDNMNYINLRKYYSETLGQSALSIIHLENGEKAELLSTRVPVDDVPVYLRLNIRDRRLWFEWSYDGTVYARIGDNFDTTKFSDEYSRYGEFTGSFVGLTCADRVKHRHYADFDFFEYVVDSIPQS